jgi:hypothetical protein
MEDLVAIWSLASNEFNPKPTLVGADPWIYNSKFEQDSWKTLQSEYNLALDNSGLSGPNPTTWSPKKLDRQQIF